MKRTYLALAGLALAGSALPAALPSLARAAGLFEGQPLDGERFAILARPVGVNDWNLLVLEQLRPQPLCWQSRGDGLIDPSLNRFDYTGICSRYLDSNGYSLRVDRQDLATTYRLQVQQVGSELQLQATTGDDPTVLVVGRGEVPRRDRDGFVPLRLTPGWELQRRTFSGRSLNHLYFANGSRLADLIAQAGGGRDERPTLAGAPGRQGFGLRGSAAGGDAAGGDTAALPTLPGRTIALQVIPFRE